MKEPLQVVLKGMTITDADGKEVCVMEAVTYRNLSSHDVHMIEKTVIGGLIDLGKRPDEPGKPDK
jgi:hypothetical protein